MKARLIQLYADLDFLEQDLKSIGADLSEVREMKQMVWIDLQNL